MSAAVQLVAGLALVWAGGGLAFWSLYAPEGRIRGPMRAAGFVLGAALFVGGIVLSGW